MVLCSSCEEGVLNDISSQINLFHVDFVQAADTSQEQCVRCREMRGSTKREPEHPVSRLKGNESKN